MHWADRIGRRLKLRDLHILLVVAQSGSMAKAADELSISHPVVSKAIADLEHTVGVRLFDRSSRGVKLTTYGSALVDHGLVAFDELRQAVKRIEFLADPTTGEIRIGTSVLIAEGFAASVIDLFSRKHPRVTIHLLAAESSMTYRALEERKVDLVIVGIFGEIAEEHMRSEILYREPYVVVAGVQNPLTRRRVMALADLRHEPWTLPLPNSLTGGVVSEIFQANGLGLPLAAVITDSIPARNALVKKGRFLTIVPASVLRYSSRQPELKALSIKMPETARRPVAILTLKNRTISPAVQLFIELARELADPLAKWPSTQGSQAEVRT